MTTLRASTRMLDDWRRSDVHVSVWLAWVGTVIVGAAILIGREWAVWVAVLGLIFVALAGRTGWAAWRRSEHAVTLSSEQLVVDDKPIPRRAIAVAVRSELRGAPMRPDVTQYLLQGSRAALLAIVRVEDPAPIDAWLAAGSTPVRGTVHLLHQHADLGMRVVGRLALRVLAGVLVWALVWLVRWL